MFGERALAGHVVVVTGASSGLGRETAIQFAGHGCQVVLAARRLDALEETARECREAGGSALVVGTDITCEEDVQQLAAAALRFAGRIDVWVNNADVALFAPLEEQPFDEHRRVIETNLFGAMHGARAVVPIFKCQRSGTLIDVDSVSSKVGQPLVPAYVISKCGVRGLFDALRTDLAGYPDIHVCSLVPYAIDAPYAEAGGATKEPAQTAVAPPAEEERQKVARAIVGLAKRPRPELHVPKLAALAPALHRFVPRAVQRVLASASRNLRSNASTPPAWNVRELWKMVRM